MGADASDPAAYKALVDEKMMIIFEACSFQDITGQRIAKVVETLQHIEQRVARFADVMQREGSRRLHQRRRNARAPSARRSSCSTARSSPARASTSPMVDEMFA